VGPRNKIVNCCTQRKTRGGDSSYTDLGIVGIKPIFKKEGNSETLVFGGGDKIFIRPENKKFRYKCFCVECGWEGFMTFPNINKKKLNFINIRCPRCRCHAIIH